MTHFLAAMAPVSYNCVLLVTGLVTRRTNNQKVVGSMPANIIVCVSQLTGNRLGSGDASYGAKGLKPLQFLLQPLQNFCVKQCIVSTSIFLWTKIKIVVTGCHILRPKCTEIDFFWALTAYSAPQTTWLEGVLLLRQGKGRKL